LYTRTHDTHVIKQLRDERQKAAAQVERLTQAIEAPHCGPHIADDGNAPTRQSIMHTDDSKSGSVLILQGNQTQPTI
jgi:hypothetical protein